MIEVGFCPINLCKAIECALSMPALSQTGVEKRLSGLALAGPGGLCQKALEGICPAFLVIQKAVRRGIHQPIRLSDFPMI